MRKSLRLRKLTAVRQFTLKITFLSDSLPELFQLENATHRWIACEISAIDGSDARTDYHVCC